jgi:hypothetical protein
MLLQPSELTTQVPRKPYTRMPREEERSPAHHGAFLYPRPRRWVADVAESQTH